MTSVLKTDNNYENAMNQLILGGKREILRKMDKEALYNEN